MKKKILLCFLLSFLMEIFPKNKSDNIDCCDKKFALIVAEKMAKKILKRKFDKFTMSQQETENFYYVNYDNIQCHENPQCKGGGNLYIKIDKRN